MLTNSGPFLPSLFWAETLFLASFTNDSSKKEPRTRQQRDTTKKPTGHWGWGRGLDLGTKKIYLVCIHLRLSSGISVKTDQSG